MSRLRFVCIALLAVVLLAGGLIVVIWSTTFVQTRLVGWALGSLQQRFGIVGHATRVELDLSRLALTVEELSLAAEDHLDQPFFTVDHARVDLPWSSLWSDFALQEVALVHPQVTVVTAADGVSNLPSGGNEEDGDFAGPPAQVSIGSLDVRDLTVDWQDDALPMRLTIGPTTLSLTSEGTSIAGPLHLDGGAVLEVAGEQLAINEAEGRLTFDGSSLGLDRLTLRAAEGTLVADGRVGNVLSTPEIDLTLVGDVDLAAVAARVSGEATGAVTITAEIRGSPSELSAAVTIDAETVQWDSLAASEIEGRLLVAPSTISIEMLTARVAGGAVAANGSMTMADAVDSDLELEWRDVDVDRLLAMLPQVGPSTVETSMTMTGNIVATWTGRGLGNATMEARNRVRQGDRTGETRVSGLGGRWQIDADVPFADAARATGTAAVRVGGNSWHEWTIDGKFLLSCDALRECQETMAPSLAEDSPDRELSGRLDAELTLAGSLGDPSATGSITASDVVVFGLPPLTVVTQASVGTTSLDVASAEIRLGDNTLRAQGRLAWDSGALEATAAGELADLEALTPILPIPWAPRGTVHMRAAVGGVWSAPVVDELVVAGNQIPLTPYSPGTPNELPISGLLDFELSVSGAVDDLSGTARLHATDLSVDSYLVGTVDSSFTLANRVVLGRVEVPELGSVGDLTFDFTDAPQAALAVQLTNTDLNRLSAGVVPLTGHTSADLQLTHRFDGTAGSPELELLLHRLEGSLAGTPLSLRQPGRFHYDANGVGVDRVDLAIGASHVRLEGGLSRDGRNTLVGSLEGPASDIGSLLRVIPNADAWASEMSFGGTLAMDFRLTGQPDAPQLSGEIRVDDGQVTVSAQPPVEDLDLRATLRAGVLRLDRLTAAWQDASLRATGTIPISIFTDSVPAVLVPPNSTGDVAVLRLEIDSITPTALAGYLDPSTVEALDGTLDVVIDLEATEPRVEAVRGSITLPVGRLTISGVPLEQRRETRVEIGDGQLRVAAFDWGSGEDYLTLGGSVTMGDDAQVDLSVTGEVDVRLFSALVPAGATAGHALLIANAQGPLDDPSLVGTIELTDAAVRMTDPRLTVSNLNGAILLSRNAVVIHEMTGEANGGRVAGEGTLTLSGFRPLGTVRLTGERMAMDIPEGLRTEVDADLVLALGADDVVLSGTATVRRGAYREPMTLAGGVLGFLEQRQTLHVVQLDEPGALDDVQLDLQVTTAEDIRLDNNYLNAALGANIRLGGTVGTPAVTGRIALRQGGRLRFGTREYEIETGVVDLVDPAGIEPSLDVRARTRASSFDISLSVSGGPGEFRTTLESNPPLPESDIVSVLLTGQTLSESGADGGLGAREQALGLVSAELLGSAGRDLAGC